MTERQWLRCGDPTPMLAYMGAVATPRRLRLCACPCVSQVLALAKLLPEQTRAALAEVEEYADGATTGAAMKRLRKRLDELRASTPSNPRTTADDFVCYAIEYASRQKDFLRAIGYTARLLGGGFWGEPLAVPPQTDLLRCIFGNPFRPVAVDPLWLTPAAVQLAQGIYDDRAFDRLPILADALQDAGCDNDGVLNHCRHPGPHARGCWVVDLVLGKN